MLLFLRLTLAPVFIALVTLAARRWGHRVAAFVTALPAVAGPTLGFYAVQQGNAFAANAARGSLLGLIGVAAFCLAYGHAARRFRVVWCLFIGWLAFAVVMTMLSRVTVGAIGALVASIVALMIARVLLPVPGPATAPSPPPSWDLPLRMVSAATLVFVLTSVAARLGPNLSGLLTPFPIATAIIAGFTHAQQGTGAVERFLRGYTPALCSFAIFCFVLAGLLPSWSLAATVAVAIAAQLAFQGVLLLVPAAT